MEKSKKIEEGLYRHYKGPLYEVIDIAVHSETLEEFVLYKTTVPSAEYPSGTFWVRPKKMFQELIEIEGRMKPRFEKI